MVIGYLKARPLSLTRRNAVRETPHFDRVIG
jgi:hypothetical protein